MALLLKRREISQLLDLPRAMQILEGVYQDQARRGIDAVAPLRLMNRGLRLVAGRLKLQNKVGVRLSVTGSRALALIYEIESGKLLSIMGYPFSNLRIAATVGLALERLTKPDARNAGLIGSGTIAPSLIQAVTALRPVEEIKVYSRDPERREKFARDATEKFALPVRAVNSAQEAVEAADIVLVSTNSPEPALLGKWLRPGVPVFGTGRPNEFDDDVYLRAKLIIVSSKEHELGYYDKSLDKPLLRLAAEEKIRWDEVAELGQIVAQQIAVDAKSDGIYVFRESQGGYSDVALAAGAYEKALKRGLGQTVELD
jgi:ornithine cyclodeaminase/alanine dehydrogenase-like protein (mu-crystallin family)